MRNVCYKRYLRWLDEGRQGREGEDEPCVEIALQVNDSRTPKLCVNCRHLLLPYKVGHGLTFRLDQCGACGGVWFDENELGLIKGKRLHEHLHIVFSDDWQKEVSEEERAGVTEQSYTKLFGEADFKEIQRIKAWLGAHPRQSELHAYLCDDGPSSH